VEVALTEEDIQAAMASLAAYIDITAEDFQEIYHVAFQQAVRRLRGSLCARDVLLRAVVTARRDTPLSEVAARMARHGVSGLPVVDDDERLEGILSEHDFVTHAREEDGRLVLEVRPSESSGTERTGYAFVAADIMTTQVATLTEDTPLPEMASHFTRWKVHRLPVVDDDNRLRGLVSRWDLVRSILGAFSDAPGSP
jgi:CBS domain-containing membrane protein